MNKQFYKFRIRSAEIVALSMVLIVLIVAASGPIFSDAVVFYVVTGCVLVLTPLFVKRVARTVFSCSGIETEPRLLVVCFRSGAREEYVLPVSLRELVGNSSLDENLVVCLDDGNKKFSFNTDSFENGKELKEFVLAFAEEPPPTMSTSGQ